MCKKGVMQMAQTELYKMDREKRAEEIKSMSDARLLAELDDTIQCDILGLNNDAWMTLEKKKVYQAIVNEREPHMTKVTCFRPL